MRHVAVTQMCHPDTLSGKNVLTTSYRQVVSEELLAAPSGSASVAEYSFFTQGTSLPRLPASSNGQRCVSVDIEAQPLGPHGGTLTDNQSPLKSSLLG